jgi:hypothetical protein
MATGRIGVTPTLGVRWSKAPTGGTTSLSGLDDNSVSLVYSVGYEQVYRNGTLLSRGNDYTATTGTTITLVDATLTGDIIEVFAQQLVPLTDAISKGQFTAKGTLLSATAASTPGVLAVGANDTVLTADSTTSTGLKWATPSSGGMTLISTTSLTGASVTLSSIPGTYNHLQLVLRNALPATDVTASTIRFNSDSNTRYRGMGYDGVTAGAMNATRGSLQPEADNAVSTFNLGIVNIYDYTNTTTAKFYYYQSMVTNYTTTTSVNLESGYSVYNQLDAITAITLLPGSGNYTSGSVLLYGVK